MAEIPTKEEFQIMLESERRELLSEIRSMLESNPYVGKRWLNNNEMMKLLSLSYTGLQNLRIKGFSYSKIGGTIYYDYKNLQAVMKKNRVEWPY